MHGRKSRLAAGRQWEIFRVSCGRGDVPEKSHTGRLLVTGRQKTAVRTLYNIFKANKKKFYKNKKTKPAVSMAMALPCHHRAVACNGTSRHHRAVASATICVPHGINMFQQ
jgi:hypothetical protein